MIEGPDGELLDQYIIMQNKGRPHHENEIIVEHEERPHKAEQVKEYWTEHRITLIAYEAQYIYAKKP